mgnify:CR=1 FL=1
MVSTDPLGELNLLPGRLDSSRFWRGSDASLVDKWSTGSRPSLFLLLGDRPHLAELVLLCTLSSTQGALWSKSLGSTASAP